MRSMLRRTSPNKAAQEDVLSKDIGARSQTEIIFY